MTDDIYAEIVRRREAGENAALATIIAVRGSIPAYETAKLLVREDGTMLGTIGGGCVEAEVWQAAREVLHEEKSRQLTFHLNRDAAEESGLICGGTLEIFVEPILAPPRLFLFGGGHLGRAIAKAAAATGFRLTICGAGKDGAAVLAQDLPGAEVHGGDYRKVCAKLAPKRNGYIVICTPAPAEGAQVLAWALGTEARYIGVAGSERHVAAVLRGLAGRSLTAEELARVHAPMGIAIGAATPAETAVAALAEMVAVRRNHAVGAGPALRALATGFDPASGLIAAGQVQ